ncbi:unnamed protein product [Toxocara canis]|uniref:Lzipper-MIP1 domain-containing protein n=1 Tax=Toxocara canis TaxID=6265 RepID=A0A183V0A5_TOXCA|nr:unnamed protein product [Toxocara canis]
MSGAVGTHVNWKERCAQLKKLNAELELERTKLAQIRLQLELRLNDPASTPSSIKPTALREFHKLLLISHVKLGQSQFKSGEASPSQITSSLRGELVLVRTSKNLASAPASDLNGGFTPAPRNGCSDPQEGSLRRQELESSIIF